MCRYVPGSVQNVFNQAKKFEEPVFKKYAKQMLMALNHLHGAGFTCNSTYNPSFDKLILT